MAFPLSLATAVSEVTDEEGLRQAVSDVNVAEIRISGCIALHLPLTINRPVDIICPTRIDYLTYGLTDSDSDADRAAFKRSAIISLLGDAAGLRGVTIKLNVYGGYASRFDGCVASGIIVDRVDNSHLSLNVNIGACGYGIRINGCMGNQFHITSSRNEARLPQPPGDGPAVGLRPFQANHVGLYRSGRIATNANDFKLGGIPEKASIGVFADMSGASSEGNNRFSGIIQGIGGDRPCPLRFLHCKGASLRDLHIEERDKNSESGQQRFPSLSIFEECEDLAIDGVVQSFSDFNLRSCRGVDVENYSGGLVIDGRPKADDSDDFVVIDGDPSQGIRLGSITLPDTIRGTYLESQPRFMDFYEVAEAVKGSANLSGADGRVMHALSGRSGGRNLFMNPYLDSWSSNVPRGIKLGGAMSISQNGKSTGWGGSPVDFGSTVVEMGPPIAPNVPSAGIRIECDAPNNLFRPGAWVSFMIVVLVVNEGRPALSVYPVFDDVAAGFPAATSLGRPKGQWTVLRGSVRIATPTSAPPGPVKFALELREAVEILNDPDSRRHCQVGGIAIVAGQTAPKDLLPPFGV